MRKFRMTYYAPKHVVDSINECSRQTHSLGKVIKTFFPKSGFEPGTREEAPSPQESSPIRNGIIVTVNQNWNLSTNSSITKRSKFTQYRTVSGEDSFNDTVYHLAV